MARSKSRSGSSANGSANRLSRVGATRCVGQFSKAAAHGFHELMRGAIWSSEPPMAHNARIQRFFRRMAMMAKQQKE